MVPEDTADRRDPDQVLVRIDERADRFSRRLNSAAAKNALAVFKISFARFVSASSFFRALISSCLAFVNPAFSPASTRARSIQPRIVSMGMPVKS